MVERYRCYGWDIRRGEMRREDDGDWVRHSDYVALKAENEEQRERLIQFANAFDAGYAAAERALAERAGGVRFVGNIPGSSSASGFAPLTTEPAAPEGQQEAVARATIYMHNGRRQFLVSELGTKAAGSLPPGTYDLFTRPSEQAVTEAMVEAAWNDWQTGEQEYGPEAMRSALKAAMEAGRHD